MSRTFVALVSVACFATGTASANDALRTRRAVDHLIASQREDGLFRYDFDFLADAPSGEDSIVRQAGTVFALGEYLLDTGDARLVPVMRRALDALAQRSLPVGSGRVQGWLESLGVFGIDSLRLAMFLRDRGLLFDSNGPGRLVSESESYDEARSGGTSLALLAELEYRRATGDDRFREIRGAWLAGLRALRVPGQGIRDVPTRLAQGPYVDGEAWLAFAFYHESFPDDAEVARELRELEDYLLSYYAEQPTDYFYHWGAMASALRLSAGDDARIEAFAADQAERVLAERPVEADRMTCGFTEGLLSSYAALRGRREGLAARVRARAERELAHNRALQIEPGTTELALGGGARLVAPRLAEFAGAFRSGRSRADIRTDLDQHCISALLKAQRYGLAELP